MSDINNQEYHKKESNKYQNNDDNGVEADKNNNPKNDEDDQVFIKKDDKQESDKSSESKKDNRYNNSNNKDTENKNSLFSKIRNFIFPKNNQVRTLDNEVGGLEQKENANSSSKDAWDDRSEEVDKMGSADTFNSTGIKSFVWRAKFNRLKAKKNAKKSAEAADAIEMAKNNIRKNNQKSSDIMTVDLNSNRNSSSFDNQSMAQRLKNMKIDKTTAFNDNNHGNSR